PPTSRSNNQQQAEPIGDAVRTWDVLRGWWDKAMGAPRRRQADVAMPSDPPIVTRWGTSFRPLWPRILLCEISSDRRPNIAACGAAWWQPPATEVHYFVRSCRLCICKRPAEKIDFY